MKKAYIFPGQGSQFSGMGKDLYESNEQAKALFEKANEILGFRITDIMFSGSEEDLKQTKVTQPAIFIHSVVLAKTLGDDFKPDMVAGHSLGEISALVAAHVLTFEDALVLVSKRAMAMQKACEAQASTMAAVLGMEDEKVAEVCDATDAVVVAANFNCPGQVVISGTIDGINKAIENLKVAGAKRTLVLNVSGAFHSPVMEPAKLELEAAIAQTNFNTPICPIYQNVNAQAVIDPQIIKKNLVAQLTAPVLWTQSVKQMVNDGAGEFIEVGPGKVLQGLMKKIAPEVQAMAV